MTDELMWARGKALELAVKTVDPDHGINYWIVLQDYADTYLDYIMNGHDIAKKDSN
jgi:hypothetical protein